METRFLSDTTLSASANFSRGNPHPVRGYLFIAAATFFWGLSAAMGRAVFTGRVDFAGHLVPRIDPVMIAQGRTTISLLVLAPVLLLRNPAALRISGRSLMQFSLLGILGVAASNYFYYLAIERTSVATAIVLQYVAPVWVLLYMVVRRLQRPTGRRLLGVLLAVAGCALAVGFFSGRPSFPWLGLSGVEFSTVGVLAAEMAAISFAFYNVYAQHLLQSIDRWTVLTYALLWSAAFWIVVNPPWKIVALHYTCSQWVFLAIFSMTSMLIPFSFYFAGLQHLDPTRAVVTSCLEPVFAILLTAILLGEWVTPIQFAGMLIVLTATALVQRPDRLRHEPTIAVEPIE